MTDDKIQKSVLIVTILLLTTLFAGCSNTYELDESKYTCTNGWWEQYTSKFGMEFDGQLPYDFEKNPQKYYQSMAKEVNLKLKNCDYEFINGNKVYGCSICYNWTVKENE